MGGLFCVGTSLSTNSSFTFPLLTPIPVREWDILLPLLLYAPSCSTCRHYILSVFYILLHLGLNILGRGIPYISLTFNQSHSFPSGLQTVH